MKKIIYLLLIALLFAGCKKNKDKNATNEVTIKGKWKTKNAKVECYNADGNIVYSKHEEIKQKDSFYIEFDGNNKAILTDFNDTNETIIKYTYQNGCLTLIEVTDDKTDIKSMPVSQLTANDMIWQFEESNNTNDIRDMLNCISPPESISQLEESNNTNDIRDMLNCISPPESISQQIAKTITYINFIKVNK